MNKRNKNNASNIYRSKINYFYIYTELDNINEGVICTNAIVLNTLYKQGYISVNNENKFIPSNKFISELKNCMNCLSDFCDKIYGRM
jgi:hypothetical protein